MMSELSLDGIQQGIERAGHPHPHPFSRLQEKGVDSSPFGGEGDTLSVAANP